MKRKIVVFSPHPDDETFGCGGTIAKRSCDGYDVLVVIVTDGRHAFSKVLGINSDPNPEEMRRIRKKEVIKATKILGVPLTNLLFLDYEDGTLKKHEKEAEEEIVEILRKHVPVEVYFPHYRDSHPDHQIGNIIVRRCLKKLGLASANFQYTVDHKYARIGPSLERLISFFRNCLVEVDVSGYLDLKQKAIGEFKSEVSVISSRQERPVVEKIDRFLGAKERFYLVKKS